MIRSDVLWYNAYAILSTLLLSIAVLLYDADMIQSPMAHGIHWKLEGWLAAHGKTRYQLAAVMGGNARANRTTLYRLESAEQLSHKTLARVIAGCEALTGEQPGVCDLLEYQEKGD